MCTKWLIFPFSYLLVSFGALLADEEQTWSKGWHWAVYNQGPGPELLAVHQNKFQLVGVLDYYNVPRETESVETVALQGVRAEGGGFWPDETLQVKKTETAEWETIGRSIGNGRRETLTVAPNDHSGVLNVAFDAFKPCIGTHQFGRVVLSTGPAAEFELKYLAPPSGEGK